MQALKRQTLFSSAPADPEKDASRRLDTLHNLQQLRRSLAWTQAPANRLSTTAELNERLEELLVLELHQNGNRQYFTWSVRALYKHVLKCITQTTTNAQDVGQDDKKETNSNNANNSTLGDALVTPLPLGIMASSKKQPKRSRAPSVGDVPRAASQTTERAHPTYRERLGGYLHPRDMRRLVTPFSASNEPELMVRRHVMLLNFDPLRAIVLRDRLLVIVPDGADSVLVQLETRLRGGDSMHSFWNDTESETGTDTNNTALNDPTTVSTDKINNKANLLNKYAAGTGDAAATASESVQSFGPTEDGSELETPGMNQEEQEGTEDLGESEWMEMNGNKWVDLPFELQCVDAVLNVISNLLTTDTFELQEASMNYMHRSMHPKSFQSDDPLTIIRAVKDAVREMSSRVKGFCQSLDRVLDEDEDMALMNLSRLLSHPERFLHPVSPEVLDEESDEPELILESYLQTALSLSNALDLIQGQIDSADEFVNQKQDSIRNRLLFANMVISVLTLSVTCVAAVGGYFGMNVPNYLEESENAFRQIVYGSLGGAAMLSIVMFVILERTQTIPTLLSSTGTGEGAVW